MRTLLIQTLLSTGFALPALADASLLRIVPDSCSTVVYCDSWSNFQERSEQSLWTEVLRGDDGGFLLADMYSCGDLQLPRKTEALYPIAKSLRGETVMFFATGVTGLFSAVTGSMVEAQDAFSAWLPEDTPEWPRIRTQIEGAQVQMVSWPDGGCSGQSKFVAYVDHPFALGLVAADDLEALTQAVTECIARLAGDSLSSPAQGLLNARGTAASVRGIELYVDFAAFSERADEGLRDAMEGLLPDPSNMLGLDRGCWLHANFDFAGERRIDCNAQLNIPKGTLLAQLADSFGPLPANLPARLPRDLASLWAVQWNIEAFYNTLRAGFVERHGEDSVKVLDQGLAAARAASRVDVIQGLIAPLEGVFAIFSKPLARTAKPGADLFDGVGLLLGLKNGDAFCEAIESLIDASLADLLDLTDRDGADVYTFKEPGFVEGGMALLPREFVLSLNTDLLNEHVDAIHQVEGSSLATNDELAAVYDQHLGSTYFACARLDWIRDLYLLEEKGGLEEPEAERAAFLKPFLESYAVANASRTPEGFRFRFQIR